MRGRKKTRTRVSCQTDGCSGLRAFPLDMVRMLEGQPICYECYDYYSEKDDSSWWDLPPVTIFDLVEMGQ